MFDFAAMTLQFPIVNNKGLDLKQSLVGHHRLCLFSLRTSHPVKQRTPSQTDMIQTTLELFLRDQPRFQDCAVELHGRKYQMAALRSRRKQISQHDRRMPVKMALALISILMR